MAGHRIAIAGLVLGAGIGGLALGIARSSPPSSTAPIPALAAKTDPPSTRPSYAHPITTLAPPAPSIFAPAASGHELVGLQADLRASEDRLRQAIADSGASGWDKALPALLGLLGVLVGGAINVWVQRRQMTASEKAHRATAAFEAQIKIIDYRSRQANEFYHPLLLMLQRSSGVRGQLCDHLAHKNPSRFLLQSGHLFIIGTGPQPVRFRLIEAMHELATQHPETLPMVNEIVAIGEKMSGLIHDKGGLALSSHTQLTDLLGRYLAHFSILREVAAKAAHPAQLQGITYNVLYPVELDAELNRDIVFLQRTIEEWSKFSARLWNEAMPDSPMPTFSSPSLGCSAA